MCACGCEHEAAGRGVGAGHGFSTPCSSWRTLPGGRETAGGSLELLELGSCWGCTRLASPSPLWPQGDRVVAAACVMGHGGPAVGCEDAEGFKPRTGVCLAPPWAAPCSARPPSAKPEVWVL